MRLLHGMGNEPQSGKIPPRDVTRTCARCGHRLGAKLFSPGQGRCRRCRADLERERRFAGRIDERVEWERERDILVGRAIANLALLEAGQKRDYGGLDWLDKMQVELATEALHKSPGLDYYAVGLAQDVSAHLRLT